MTTRLTLVCHAATAATRAARFPRDDFPEAAPIPSPALAAAATRAGRRLTAPERRAHDTAAAFSVAFADDPGLRDQGVGRWAGRGIAEIAADEPEALAGWMGNPEAAPHGGESLSALLERVAGWMAVQAAEGGRVVGVTHPALVRAAVVSALGAGPDVFWRVEAGPMTAATLSHDGRRWTLVELRPAES